MANHQAVWAMMMRHQDQGQTVGYHVNLWDHTIDLFPWMDAPLNVGCGQVKEERGKGKGKSTSSGLLDIMIDQLPMLTERGLREMMVALSCELSFRGDVREENEEVQLAHEASGGKGSAFPPEELLEIVRTRGARGEEHEEDERPIPPGEGDRYWNEFGEEQFFED